MNKSVKKLFDNINSMLHDSQREVLTDFLIKVIIEINPKQDARLSEKLHKIAACFNLNKTAWFNPRKKELKKFLEDFRF